MERISDQSPWRRYRRTVAGTQPAAGTDWSLTVPAGSLYALVSVYAELVTSATVADRAPRLQLSTGDQVYLDIVPQAAQAASLTYRYQWGRHIGTYALGAGQVIGIPEIVLEPGSTVAVVTDNLDGTDQWSAPVLYLVETVYRGGQADLAEAPEMRVEVLSAPAV